MEHKLTFSNITLQEAEIILTAISKFPLEQVKHLDIKLRHQAAMQLSQIEEVEQEPKTES